MAMPYYIQDTSKLWINDNIAPYGTNVYYIQKIAGYTPTNKDVFDYSDDFNDNLIDDTKWTKIGSGSFSETNQTMYITSNSTNAYSRCVTTTPLTVENYIIEYDFKVSGATDSACFMGYTPYPSNDINSPLWYFYVSSDRNLILYTKTDGFFINQWGTLNPITLNTWYKIRIIKSSDGINLQLFNSSSVFIEESGYFKYDYNKENSIFFGQCSTGDRGYWDNFIMRKYTSIEPTVTVESESNTYKIIVKNNTNEELRNYQINIPCSLGSTTSVCIDVLNRTPLKQIYYNIFNDCNMFIPNMTRDITGNHVLTMYNTTKCTDRFTIVDNATTFNGESTVGVITNKSDLDLFNTNTFTLICWIKQSNITAGSEGLFSKFVNSPTNNRWKLQIYSNEVGFFIQDADSSLNFYGESNPIKINDLQWHMISFVRNTNTISAYKDGILIRTYTLTNISNFSNTNDVNIGYASDSVNYDNYFAGSFGEIQLDDTAYTATKILNYYNLTKYKYITNIKNGSQF